MAKRRKKPADGDAFIPESAQAAGAGDDLAELLAEEFLISAVSGEPSQEDARDEVLDEEIGGPFVEASPAEEFGRTRFGAREVGSDVNALPTALGGLAIASPDELSADDDGDIDDPGYDDEEAAELAEPEAEPASRVEPERNVLGSGSVSPLGRRGK
jgi:hypothetical protein